MYDIMIYNGIIVVRNFWRYLFFVIGGNVDDDLLNKILCVKKDVFLFINWVFIIRKCIFFYFIYIKNVNLLEI